VENPLHDVDKRLVPASKVARKMHQKMYEVPRVFLQNTGGHLIGAGAHTFFSFRYVYYFMGTGRIGRSAS
jgi:uncharacterized protein YjeT (DUF2065 family)